MDIASLIGGGLFFEDEFRGGLESVSSGCEDVAPSAIGGGAPFEFGEIDGDVLFPHAEEAPNADDASYNVAVRVEVLTAAPSTLLARLSPSRAA